MTSYKFLLMLILHLQMLHYNLGTLHYIAEVMDIWSEDLKDFQYFKNLPSANPATAKNTNYLLEHFQKKKAVLNYFENLFFGNSILQGVHKIPFNPQFGRAWQPYFEQKYGWRGKKLIDALGKGYSLQQLRQYGAIPKEFGQPNYPS